MDYDRIERRLKLHDVRVLLTVAEAGGMGRAAEDCGPLNHNLRSSLATMATAGPR